MVAAGLMRLKPWEIAVGGTGAAFAAILVFRAASGLGFGLLASDLLWVRTRIEILQNHQKPGSFRTIRSQALHNCARPPQRSEACSR